MNTIITAAAQTPLIVTPVLDDAASLLALVADLKRYLPDGFTLIAVDDGSCVDPPDAADLVAQGAVGVILRLKRNLGHQRAIALGLAYGVRRWPGRPVIVMDGDGEDQPQDAPRLLTKIQGRAWRVAVAERGRRSEGGSFKAGLAVYYRLFRLLVGRSIAHGNFMAASPEAAARLACMSETWLSVPASVLASRLPIDFVPCDRGVRYAGRSQMNLMSLATHGMSAIAVFSDRVLTRLLVAAGATALALCLAFVAAVAIKLAGAATPGWLTEVAGVAVSVLVQLGAMVMMGLFLVLSRRQDVLTPDVDALLQEIEELRKDNGPIIL